MLCFVEGIRLRDNKRIEFDQRIPKRQIDLSGVCQRFRRQLASGSEVQDILDEDESAALIWNCIDRLMREGGIRWVIVGADRVAANGDVANKIGTYSAALVARHHGVRFMVVAPTSTIDMGTPSGAGIPIERRDADELLVCAGIRLAAGGAQAWNPVFDVTPAELVDALVTEKGVVLSPNAEKLAELMAK